MYSVVVWCCNADCRFRLEPVAIPCPVITWTCREYVTASSGFSLLFAICGTYFALIVETNTVTVIMNGTSILNT